MLAGATAAGALSLILLVLGTGLGLSAVSPWSGQGVSGMTFGTSTIVWVTLTQIAAAGMGGYLAGRLRERWAETHVDEVYFRDTAHGFLAWALATIVTAGLLTTAVGGLVSGGVQATASAVAAGGTAAATLAAKGAAEADRPMAGDAGAYLVDTLFRRDASATEGAAPAAATLPDENTKSSVEVTRILANGVTSGALSPEDTRYVAQLVAQRTGLAPADAEKRVTETFTRIQSRAKEVEASAREAADKARKASAYAALWLFVSLLAGAFSASLAATLGGRRRDQF
ncbi:MAG: hypothetical protein ABI702_18940 [Burkholderiales bacterium]